MYCPGPTVAICKMSGSGDMNNLIMINHPLFVRPPLSVMLQIAAAAPGIFMPLTLMLLTITLAIILVIMVIMVRIIIIIIIDATYRDPYAPGHKAPL